MFLTVRGAERYVLSALRSVKPLSLFKSSHDQDWELLEMFSPPPRSFFFGVNLDYIHVDFFGSIFDL